ncbi:MAG: transcription-repair coupling factor [Oscillospiraceae bacterium]|nr:transcription-repair coupling factor [Oscillospiraceae bacterium]
MNGILASLMALEETKALLSAAQKRRRPRLTGVSSVHRAMLCAAMQVYSGQTLLVLCSDDREVQRCAADLRALTGGEVTELQSRHWQFRPAAAVSHQWEHRRLRALHRMAEGSVSVVVTTVEAAVQRCMPPRVLKAATLCLRQGERYDMEKLTAHLVCAGYSRCQQVEGPGQFALRGGILDVFSPAMDAPVRCEFWDDELDALGEFDVSSQRRTRNVDEVCLLPAGEVLPLWDEETKERTAAALERAAEKLKKKENTAALRQMLEGDAALLRSGALPAGCARYMAAVYEEMTTALDYFGGDTLVCLWESGRLNEALRASLWQLKEDLTAASESGTMPLSLGELSLSESETAARLDEFDLCMLDSLPTGRPLLEPRELLQLNAKQMSTYGGSLDTAAQVIRQYLDMDCRVVVLCGGEVRANNMVRLLRERDIAATYAPRLTELPPERHVTVSLGALSAGSEWPQLRLAVLTEGQLTESVAGKARKVRKTKDESRQKLQSYTDLTPGDLVVHEHHGIGRFVEMLRLPVDGVEKDYIKIAYAGTDCLYVPATSLDLVSKYIGSGGGEDTEKPVRLNKLGGSEWAKTTYRARAAAKELAEGLIKLYAARQRLGGFAFSSDSPWQQEFEDAFPYDETDDQLRAVTDIKADMERPVPMDRLLCGDVGYGKTEVALRAVMKCILDGKQAAILVPTTVLAQQHYVTAQNRFRAFPVTIEVLSRFRSPKQVKEVLQRVKEGRVDLLIGTHKLLSKQLEFKDLGLLVIDEEQRFGVAHKEKLRERTAQVDTLTLSATPIPRTLNMALSGIRDMSTIEEPPRDRRPVQTYVLEHDWSVVAEAIRRELSRGGQVYYLHNRVDSIDAAAARLRQMLGEETVIAVAHGKMSEAELSRVMQEMSEGEIQVLVCTTIIETGLDIPNVNTMIIEDADRMGLSQLHQLRGRIGRSSRRASAYLTYRPGKILTEVAAKRLSAIREYVEFGSGFKIAMRDLEIRGAGNLLGPEQSGYMMSVGYDMYLKLLNEAVLEQQGKIVTRPIECAADLTVSAYIPESYVPSARQRMDLYRRIAAVRCTEDADDLTDELLDRYGDVPQAVQHLMEVALLRARAAAVGITDITQRSDKLSFTMATQVDVAALAAVCSMASYRRRLQLHASAQDPRLTLYLAKGEDALDAAVKLVETLHLQHKQTGDTPDKEEKDEKANI